jgi:hypothetical protein
VFKPYQIVLSLYKTDIVAKASKSDAQGSEKVVF